MRAVQRMFLTGCMLVVPILSVAERSSRLSVDVPLLDQLFSKYDTADTPGVSVIAIQGDAILYAGSHGLADLESKRRMTPETPVRLASLSKQFTAMAVMILAERGLLSYDDDVVDWIPELERIGKDITIRHLLNNTSGLPEYYDFGANRFSVVPQPTERLTKTEQIVSFYKDWGELRSRPGDRFEYSDASYELLAVVVERITHTSFARFLEQEIFRPLGMSHSFVRDCIEADVPERAIGYRPDEESGWVEEDTHELNCIVGAGGIYSSVIDLYSWIQALDRHQLVRESTMAEALSPATLNDGGLSPYGFGWFLIDQPDGPSISHSGAWLGFSTIIDRYPKDALTCIVLSNASAKAEDLNREMARLILSSGDTR